MLASFSSIERQRDAGYAPRDSQMLPGAIDQQILEAERALERMKRDLVMAQARA